MPPSAVLSWGLETWSCSASIPTRRSSVSAFIGKSSTRPIPSSTSCCVLSRTITSTKLSRTGTEKSKVNTPLSVTWRSMGGKKTPPHGWPMSLTAATARLRFRFARKALKERCCPGPRYSAGLPSSSRRIGSTPQRNRTDLKTSTLSPSGRRWQSTAL